MTKCANCSSSAYFVYQMTENFAINYCSRHLPKFLLEQKRNLVLHRITPVDPELEAAAPAKASKKKSAPAPVVEEPVVEAPVVEEPAVVEETPKEE